MSEQQHQYGCTARHAPGEPCFTVSHSVLARHVSPWICVLGELTPLLPCIAVVPLRWTEYLDFGLVPAYILLFIAGTGIGWLLAGRMRLH